VHLPELIGRYPLPFAFVVLYILMLSNGSLRNSDGN
jgi:hypothetical protein